MTGKRRALVAPQNTFLETIIRRTSAHHYCFVLTNARLVDHPVVYVSDEFCKLTGYSKTEVLNKNHMMTFMHGPLTEAETIQKVRQAFVQELTEQVEMMLYKKNHTPIWLLVEVAPVRNESGVTIMFAMAFKDISSTRQPDDDSKLSKFARLARHITKNRNTLSIVARNEMQKQASVSSQFQGSILQNLPDYKQEPPKTPPSVILHYGNFKSVWNWIILLLTFYTSVMVPANVAFHNKSLDSLELVIIDGCIDTVFLLDILLNFRTTFVGRSKEVVSDPKLIRRNYMRSWFIIDVLSCLPYDALQLVIVDEGSSALSALKVLRLLRLGRVVRRLDQYLEYGAAVLVLLICLFLLVAHWMACIWYTLGVSEQETVYGWYRTMSNHVLRNQSGTHNVSKSMAYLTSMYFTLSCMTSVGFGNVSANTELEKLFTIFLMVLGALLFATIFGNVTTIFQQLYSATSKYHDVLNSVSDFMRIYNVPADLQNRVLDYIVSTWFMSKGVDTNKVLSHCPKDMKADICVHLNRAVFNEHSAFRLASEGCLRALAMHFTMNHSAPGDTVVRQGDSVDSLFFVASGSLEVSQDDEIVAILTKGDVFGDCFWLQPTLGQSQVTVKTLTYSDLHIIKKDKLMDVLNFYHTFANSFARNLILTYNLRDAVMFCKMQDQAREQDKRIEKPSGQLSSEHPVRKLMLRFRRLSEERLNTAAIKQAHELVAQSNASGGDTVVAMGTGAAEDVGDARLVELPRLGLGGKFQRQSTIHESEADVSEAAVDGSAHNSQTVARDNESHKVEMDLLNTMKQLIVTVNDLRYDTKRQLLEVEKRVCKLEENVESVRDTLFAACSQSSFSTSIDRVPFSADRPSLSPCSSKMSPTRKVFSFQIPQRSSELPQSLDSNDSTLAARRQQRRISLLGTKQCSNYPTRTINDSADESTCNLPVPQMSTSNNNSYDETTDYADGLASETRDALLAAYST